MSTYHLDVPDIGVIKVTKKRGMRSLRMRINPKGEVLVSSPWAMPRSVIQGFINERKEWIIKNTADASLPLENGMIFGIGTVLHLIENCPKNHSKLTSNELIIRLDGAFDPNDLSQQKYIEKKVIGAMTVQAEEILLPRLEQLALATGHEFNQAYVKRLSSRWGSCDSQKNIILNVFLIQLPSQLQNYVMLHELTHTRFMNHSPQFWGHMENHIPSVKLYKKLIKQYRPRIEPVI